MTRLGRAIAEWAITHRAGFVAGCLPLAIVLAGLLETPR